MNVIRTEPSFTGDERHMLQGWLDYHRATLLLKCEGVPHDRLRERAIPSSNLSLIGLVRHMIEVERGWFLQVMKGERFDRGIYWTPEDEDGDFNNVDTTDIPADFALYESTCQESRDISASFEDFEALSPPSPRGQLISLRWVHHHMIEEYARHNGHADLLREAIDGVTGE